MSEPRKTYQQAQALWEERSDDIRGDAVAAQALERLEEALATLREKMRAARMDRICRVCGEHNDGGCCGASVARQVDPWLLLAGRLLGTHATPMHHDPTTCCFLGPDGCVLALKPFICVQYDCREMIASVDPGRLAAVQQARDELLDAWVVVESRLRELCREDR